MFGIKDEAPKKEENKDIIPLEYKKENTDIKIIETTIILPLKEKIKSKSCKRENKKSNEDNESKIYLFTEESKENSKDSDKMEKKEEKDEEKNASNNNIFNSKPSKNALISSIEGEAKNKEINDSNNEKSKNIFGGLINNKESEKIKNKQQSKIDSFGNMTEYKDNKDNTKKSLFGNINVQKGDKNNSNEKSVFSNNITSLFGTNNNKSLFSRDNKTSLFSFGNNDNKPLFSNNNAKENNNNSPLFSNNNIFSNPFCQIKGESFIKANFNSINNDENKKKLGESLFGDNLKNENPISDDDDDDERDMPKTVYVTEPLKAQDYSNYTKLYNIQLNKLFLFNKNENKFISKGNGFFSIEKLKEEKDKLHQAVIVFRNQTGNKIVEGLVDKKFEKVDITNKDFNYVVSFGFIMMIEGKPELGYIRIPFTDEKKAKELKEAFTKAISFVKEK